MEPADYGLLTPAWAGTTAADAASDGAFAQAMLDVESAWVRVQARAGLCSQADAEAVREAAAVELYDLGALAARGPDGGNPLIPLLGQLRAKLQAAGAPASALRALHRGATSQDIVDSALMLLAARTRTLIRADLLRAGGGLARLAALHADTPAVARTLTQHALPTTFGLRAANWLAALVDAGRRLDAVVLPLQWGGAAGTLASLREALSQEALSNCHPDATEGDLDARIEHLTAELAGELGLSAPRAPWHTNRLPLLELGAALGGVVAAAGTFGADVLTGSRPEIGELREPREEGRGGSSAMPHKQNPVHSVLLRNAALTAPGHVATLFTAAGTAVDERPDGGWHSEWAALRELLRLAGGAAAHAAELAVGLQVDAAALARNLGLSKGLLLSERIATVLAPLLEGGKAGVEALVRDSLEEGRMLGEVVRAAVPAEALSDDRLAELLDPRGYLGSAAAITERICADFTAWRQP